MKSGTVADMRRDAPQPLYQQLVERLKKMMAEMAEKGEKMLPSERELCRLFSVSHTTVRLALKELEVAGLLLRVPGKGTFIGDPADAAGAETLVYGVILEKFAEGQQTDFRVNLLGGMRQAARKAGVSLMLLGEEDEIFMTLARSRKLAGLVVTNPMLAENRMRELKQLGLPLVTIGRAPMRGIPWVDNDNVAVGRAMTEHLLERGCRNIGFIGLDRAFTLTADRLAGYKEALKAAGIVSRRKLILFREAEEKTGYREAEELLAAGADGIVCIDDLIAMGVLHCLHERGKRCPDDVAVIGCNNSSFAEFSFPPLSSVDIRPEQIGRDAVEILEKNRLGREYPPEMSVPFLLHKRQSTWNADKKRKSPPPVSP